MIIDWLKYIKDNLLISIRNTQVLQFIYVLLAPAETQHSELTAYMDKARIYASCTWQVCWLEQLLRTELDDQSITITEGDGLPIDFIVYSNLIDNDRLRALLNRFKMVGKSYQIISNNIITTIRWIDPACEKIIPTPNVRWIDPACEKIYAPLRILYADGISIVYSLWFSASAANLSLLVDYPGPDLSASQTFGGDGCWLSNFTDTEIPHRKSFTITIESNGSHDAREFEFTFLSGGEQFILSIYQDL